MILRGFPNISEKILFCTIISRCSKVVQRTDSLVVILTPQRMTAEEITLCTADLQNICSTLLQNMKDLSFPKKHSLLCPFFQTALLLQFWSSLLPRWAMQYLYSSASSRIIEIGVCFSWNLQCLFCSHSRYDYCFPSSSLCATSWPSLIAMVFQMTAVISVDDKSLFCIGGQSCTEWK